MRWINLVNRGTKDHAMAATLIFAVTLIFFLPVLRGRTFSMVAAHMFSQYPWIGVTKDSPEVGGRGFPQTDHPEGLYPTSVFATNAVRSGQFPMWLPYSFSGIPIMETGQGNGLLYPPQLLAMTFLSPVRQHDVLLFTHLLLSGLGMYALLRFWDANVWGAVFGAIVWELNGHNSFFLLFEFAAVAAAWFPLMMLGASLTIRKQSWRWALATGVAVGMSILHGVQHFEYVGVVVLTFWYGALTIIAARRLLKQGKRRSALLCLSLPVISAVTSAALSAASWLSLVSLLSHVHRQPLSLEQQLGLITPAVAFVRALVFPTSSVTPWGYPDFASFGFVGIPALILIPAAFLRRSAPILLASIMGLVGLGMLLGIRPLLSFFRLVLPYFGTLRLWDGYYLLCFAIAVLAAFGLSEIIQRFKRGNAREYFLPTFVFPLIGVECLQLIMFAWTITPTQPATAEWLFPETPLITNLKVLQGQFHMLPVYFRDPSGKWMPPPFAGKAAVGFGLRSSSGYESLLPVSTANLWRTVQNGGAVATGDIPVGYRPYFYHDRLPISLLEKLSVGLIATQPNTQPRDADGSDPVADGSLKLVYQGPDGWIYKLPHSLPRAFLVPQVIAAPDRGSALPILVDRNFDARRAAIVIGEMTAVETGLPTLDSSPIELAASANIVSDRVNEVEVEVDTPRAALLVLNDSWDGGWKGHVDGVEQPVLRVNYAFRGLVVPEGKHRVVFIYRPPLLLLGLGISGFAMLLLMIIFAWIGGSWLRRFRKNTNDEIMDQPVHRSS